MASKNRKVYFRSYENYSFWMFSLYGSIRGSRLPFRSLSPSQGHAFMQMLFYLRARDSNGGGAALSVIRRLMGSRLNIIYKTMLGWGLIEMVNKKVEMTEKGREVIDQYLDGYDRFLNMMRSHNKFKHF